MEDTQRNGIIEDYRNGTAKFKLAQKYHCSKITINKVLKEATDAGILPEGFVKSRDDAYYRSEKKILESQVKYATVCDLWKKGYTYDEIKYETGMCFETIKKYVRKGQESGDLFQKNSEERKMALQVRKSLISGTEPGEHRRIYHKVESTLKPGETVKCTQRVSRSCVYGCRKLSEQMCRYSLVTGKCRTVGPRGERVNPLSACTCYSKVSKTNPKINNATED